MRFSILLYTKGDESTILGVLNSINNQTDQDFECIILDDNSKDSTKELYQDFCESHSKFRYIRSEYDKTKLTEKDLAGISNIINTGIEYSTGDYIVFCNGHEKLLLTRLEKTREDLKNNPQVDLISYRRDFGSELIKFYSGTDERTIKDLIKNGSPSLWETTLVRENALSKLPWLFRQPLDEVFCTQFFLTALSHGMTLAWSLDESNQVNNYKYIKESEGLRIRYLQMFLPVHQNKGSNEMTVLVTFKNEGFEVEKTVIAIRLNDQSVNIQLVNDASTDTYNYKNISKTFGCDYLVNQTSQGVAGARCVGVEQIKTPYFIIFDAHMRFKISDLDFSKKFIKELKKDDNQILYANTIVIHSNTEEDCLFRHYNNEDCLTNSSGHNGFLAYGALHKLSGAETDWDTEWCYKFNSKDDCDNDDPEAIIETVSILGATYAMSKRWWSKIRGLNCLYYWGSDEPWLSTKTILFGGHCRMFKNYGVGHLYRSIPTYGALDTAPIQVNRLMLQYMLSENDEEFNKYINIIKEKSNKKLFDEITSKFKSHIPEYKETKKWLKENAVYTPEKIRQFNAIPRVKK